MTESSILVVDDIPENIQYISELLKDHYKIKIATNGEKALKIADSTPQPDLVLLDIQMPGMDGYEVCQRLKDAKSTRDIPVIFLTGMSSMEDERRGLELGAVDYIAKPISPSVLLVRVKTHLRLREASQFLKHQNQILEEKVQQRTRQLAILQDTTMVAMGSLAETRDSETGNHIRRTQRYIKTLASCAAEHPRFNNTLDEDFIDLLYKSAPLHDIGKVGVPDNILLKPAKLSPAEFDIMKLHTVYGRNAIDAAEKCIDRSDSNDFLAIAKEIAYSHQEKWDGSGYPEGLSGDDIPVAARLMAIADVYDALISKRVYKEAFPHEEAVHIIRQGKGIHFDPDLADIFLTAADEFNRIALQFSDSEEINANA